MAARFTGDSEVPARRTPFATVRGYTSPAGAELREQMRQLVTQRAIDLCLAEFVQARIQRDQLMPVIRATRCAAQSAAPLHTQCLCDPVRSMPAQELPSFPLQSNGFACRFIARRQAVRLPCNLIRRFFENKLELLNQQHTWADVQQNVR